jgi:hypothetical protein
MGKTGFEGYTVGEIEHDIPFTPRHGKPLSIEQKHLLQLKNGESFVLSVRFGPFLTDNAERLMQWARLKGIHTVRRKIDDDSVRIWRVEALPATATDKRKK